MARAVAEGAGDLGLLFPAHEADGGTLLAASGYVFVCPENLGSMSGIMKDMFDRTYYPVLGRIEGRAYATAIAAGSDGEGAERQIDRIVTGWRLRRVAESLIVNLDAQRPETILAQKSVSKEDLERCHDLGKAFGEGIRLGIY
ncbi:NAD(P)H-dependent oxidoreductase [Novosphingobium sp. MW5]|nr:NAD(P)H-dependent oxidoreductase [Novosphingobium sp. MW5]